MEGSDDREQRRLRKALINEEEEKRRRLLHEQSLIQAQREEYLKNQRRKREEATRREEYLLEKREEEMRRKLEEQRMIQVYREEEMRRLKIQSEQLAREERRRQENVQRKQKDEDQVREQRTQEEIRFLTEQKRKEEELYRRRIQSENYIREQMKRSEDLSYEEKNRHFHVGQEDYEGSKEQEYLDILDETGDQLFDIEAERLKTLASTGKKSEKDTIPKYPGRDRKQQLDMDTASKSIRSAGDSDEEPEPCYIIEQEIAALDRRLTLLAQEKHNPRPKEENVTKESGSTRTKDEKKTNVLEQYLKDTSGKMSTKESKKQSLMDSMTDEGVKKDVRSKEDTQSSRTRIDERDFRSESSRHGQYLCDKYNLPPEDKTLQRSELKSKRELKFDDSIGYRTTLEEVIKRGDRSKEDRQTSALPCNSKRDERNFQPETTRYDSYLPANHNLPYGDRLPPRSEVRSKGELRYEDSLGYDNTPLLEYAFTQGYRKALEKESLPWASKDLFQSHDTRDYARSSYENDDHAGEDVRYQVSQPKHEDKYYRYQRTGLSDKEASGLKKETEPSFKTLIVEKRRQKEELLKAKEEDLRQKEIELKKKESWVKEQEILKSLEEESDPYDEMLAQREKELNEIFDKMQARQIELQERENALLKKQTDEKEHKNTVKKSDTVRNEDTITKQPDMAHDRETATGKTSTGTQCDQTSIKEIPKLCLKSETTMTENTYSKIDRTSESKAVNPEQFSFPKITAFSGEDPKPKTEASFEEWKYEVNCLRRESNYSDSQIAQAVRKSLRAQAKRVLLPLGTSANIPEIMTKLEGVFGNVATGESILAEFYTAAQKQDESVAAWGLRLEEILQKAIEKGQVKQEDKNDMLREKFWRAIRSDRLKNATRVHFESVSNFELLRRAVRAEEHQMKLYSGIKQQQLKVEGNIDESKEEDSKYDQLMSRISSLEKQLKYNRRQGRFGRNRYKPKGDQQEETEVKESQKENKLNC